jgi:hypothetical protein
MGLKASMRKNEKEERDVLVVVRRGSGSRPEERGSRPPTAGALMAFDGPQLIPCAW